MLSVLFAVGLLSDRRYLRRKTGREGDRGEGWRQGGREIEVRDGDREGDRGEGGRQGGREIEVRDGDREGGRQR